jgi:glucose/mannose transport system substrate-binding protein
MTEDENVSRRTYLTAAGVTGAAGMTALSGCLGGGDSGSDDSTSSGDGGDSDSSGDDGDDSDSSSSMNPLEVQHAWGGGDGKAAFSALIEGFKEEYPDVTFDVQPVSGGANKNLNSVIKKRARNQNLPGTWQDWPGANLLQFTEANLLGDIEEDVWSQNDMKDAYLEGPKRAARPDGTYVTVPINIHRLNNLFYNKSLIEESSIDVESLSSPDDLIDAMSAVGDNTEAVGMAQSTKAPWTSLQLWAAVFMGNHGASAYMDFLNGDANRDDIKNAFETVANYADYFNSDAATISWTEGNSKVMNGDAAFIHQGDWAAGAYRGNDDFNYDDDWGHIPFPGTSGMYALNMDSFPYGTNGGDGNPSPEATKKFLTYCGTKDAQIRFNKNKGSIPPRSDVSSDEFGPFLSKQMDDFSNSDAQPPSVTHGLGVKPGVLSDLKSVVSDFTANLDPDAAADGFVQVFE